MTIGAKRVGEDKLDIFVEDAGVGIDPIEHDIIFEPFTRLSYATENNIQGAGNLSGAISYSGAFVALVALIYLTAVLVLQLSRRD